MSVPEPDSLTQCTLICQFVCGEVGDNNEVKDSKELGAWKISLLSHSSGSLCDAGCWLCGSVTRKA